MALPLIPILLLGGAVMVLGGAKKGGGGGYLFDGQCRGTKLKVQNVQQLAALARRLGRIASRVWRDTWGIELTPEQLLSENREPVLAAIQSIIGQAPGNRITNIAFCRATATGIVMASANPACLQRVEATGLTGAEIAGNVLDRPDWMMLPPGAPLDGLPMTHPALDDFLDLAAALQGAFDQAITDLAAAGYDVGVTFAMAGPRKSHAHELAERMAR
jgi:hypothetical protein